MTDFSYILEHQAGIDPTSDLEPQLTRIPAKWVVYLLSDAEGRPLQLLCVKNLRASLRRRLGESMEQGPSKRINYREVVRKVHWRRVDSAFEADWVYYEAARQIFPETYRNIIGFRHAWFIHVNPEAQFPRYVKTDDVTNRAGVFIGPMEEKQHAAGLIELIEDAFDLCRYHNVLTQSPQGKACAYKEMGKCPAPCDGTISLEQYRRLVEWSARVATDPDEMIRDQQKRMNQAATELRFETAGRIKQYIEQLSRIGTGAFRHIANLKDFVYVTLQRGPRENSAKVFLITPGRIEHIACLCCDLARPAELMRLILESAERAGRAVIDEVGNDRIGIVSHHLFSPKGGAAQFLPLRTIDEKQLLKAFKDLRKQKIEAESDDEGVLKELNSAGPISG